jgi:class 3 adenylate cyclase/energy-coupling factor transporter ATP-binding protein EcfA2
VVRTFLISDIRGYSTFTRERGDETAARLAMRFADLAVDAVEARGGTVLGLRGDEALAVFDSTPQAVRAALEFQEACREATDEDPELPLPVGIGIDRGAAIPVEDGYRGKALNMAARLCSKAAAGQVFVTMDVAELARGLEDVAFESRGTAELKGFDQPVELLEVRSTIEARVVGPQAAPSKALLPPELDDFVPLADREHERRWLRGTWRQARRGHGRVVFVSGPAGIGKTRLAAELAAYVYLGDGAVRYAGAGGAGGAETLAAIAEARSAAAPILYVVDELNLYGDAIAVLGESIESIEFRPVLLLGVFREAERQPELAELVDRVDARGDGHRRLGPLGLDGVVEIARTYVGDVEELPAESMLRASGGVPARVHEVVSEWARDEAKRRLTAAAEWLAAGKDKQAAGLEFANNVIALKLGRIYQVPDEHDLADSCPYKGLAAFEESDAAYFYGRERVVGELAARTVGMGMLGVVGPSGSGKSSVVMAGLLPSLAAGLLPGSARWGHVILRPGEHPVDALDSALASGEPGERLILMVDQFEEVFSTTVEEPERAAFVDRLVELARDPERCVVAVTIRADYTGHCAQYAELAELLASNLMLVGPMTPDELRRAIELPARRVGLRVESALVDALVGEVGEEPGGLPLLSTALVELWQARDGGWLRLEAHERTGGVRGAVSRLAEASFEGLEGEEREAARAILLRLVGRGEGDAAVRRRVPVLEFDRTPAVESVLNAFTRDRLLTAADGTVEVAHEALIREWPRLRGWLEEDVQGREIRAHITQSAKQWDERDREPAEL